MKINFTLGYSPFSFFNQKAVWKLRLKIHTCNVRRTPHIYCSALLQGRCKLPAALWKSQHFFLYRNDRTQCEHAERLERVLSLDFYCIFLISFCYCTKLHWLEIPKQETILVTHPSTDCQSQGQLKTQTDGHPIVL